jgi:hypothetical protein
LAERIVAYKVDARKSFSSRAKVASKASWFFQFEKAGVIFPDFFRQISASVRVQALPFFDVEYSITKFLKCPPATAWAFVLAISQFIVVDEVGTS